MARSYRAILKGNRLQWLETPPVSKDPVEIEIVIADAARSGEKMAAALEQLASLSSLE